MKQELYKVLMEYNDQVTSFHMPGHKGKGLYPFPNSYAIDVTEVPGTDDLYHAEGILAEAMERIRKIYKTKESILLVNGSTAGLTAAIRSIGKPGDTIAIARNCHKSVYNAILMNDYKVHYVEPMKTDVTGIFGSIDPHEIDKLLKSNPEIKAFVVTSPTYEGVVSDIGEISKKTHANHCALIVDEAHGAHFQFAELLPESACGLGADIVIQSTHKTLPALTQTALCHVMSWDYVKRKRLIEALQMAQTSSPSYVLMASIDSAVQYMHTHRSSYLEKIQQIKRHISGEIEGGYFLSKEKPGVYDQDCTRLTFVIDYPGITGYQFIAFLREQFCLQAETAGLEHVIFITTIADGNEAIGNLVNVIREAMQLLINRNVKNKLEIKKEKNPIVYPKTKAVMTMYQAYYSETRMELVEDGLGCVSASFLIPYPPGIPLVCPGEVITQDILDRIKEFRSNEWEIYGIIDARIEVVDI